jgi:hypothetical protein
MQYISKQNGYIRAYRKFLKLENLPLVESFGIASRSAGLPLLVLFGGQILRLVKLAAPPSRVIPRNLTPVATCFSLSLPCCMPGYMFSGRMLFSVASDFGAVFTIWLTPLTTQGGIDFPNGYYRTSSGKMYWINPNGPTRQFFPRC